MSITNRLKSALSAFRNREPTNYNYGMPSYIRNDRLGVTQGYKGLQTAIYNRIALDVAAVDIRHVRLDSDERFVEEIHDNLNECLSLQANIDQTSRAFIQDIVISCLDEGCVAVVPTYTSKNNDYDILEMRVGKITQWYPQKIEVELYNDETGKKEKIIRDKDNTAIIENPLYAVINDKNSVAKRLARKMNLLDIVDEKNSSGKLDLLIQLPYSLKSEGRKLQAKQRKQEIEDQMINSKYGIAYIDSTEHITQLNRPVENNLMSQIEFYKNMLFSQLGMTESVLNGDANESVMLNYYTRTIEPFLAAIASEFRRKFLSITARSQRQDIRYYFDSFKLLPLSELAKIADTFTRNEIVTKNEMRQVIGFKPSSDPRADELRNSNIRASNDQLPSEMSNSSAIDHYNSQMDEISEYEDELNYMESEFGG